MVSNKIFIMSQKDLFLHLAHVSRGFGVVAIKIPTSFRSTPNPINNKFRITSVPDIRMN